MLATLDLSALTTPELRRFLAEMTYGIYLCRTAQFRTKGEFWGLGVQADMRDVKMDIYDELDRRDQLFPISRTI